MPGKAWIRLEEAWEVRAGRRWHGWRGPSWMPEPATGMRGGGSAAPRRGGRGMGKYKQWLHHQEIGRRPRDQINNLEQERARGHKKAPAQPTAPPQVEKPVIAAV